MDHLKHLVEGTYTQRLPRTGLAVEGYAIVGLPIGGLCCKGTSKRVSPISN